VSKESWPTEWLKGILPLCVLSIVMEGETYGYAIAQALERQNIPNVKGGTLYPLLNRLEQDGLVEARWMAGPSGPGRKLYAPTKQGRAWVAENTSRWYEFAHSTTALLRRNTKGNTR
jgi:PadR family transcriptional regulator, regulatory protein PadR